MNSNVSYPATYSLDAPLKIARWRPLVHWLLSIPHLIVLYVLNIVAGVLWILSFICVLFGGKIPRGIFDFSAMILRYHSRVTAFLLCLTEQYPPFSFTSSASDPGGYAVKVDFEYPQKLSHLLPLIKWLLLIPQLIVILVLAVFYLIALVIGFFAILFLGKWPEGLRNFVVGFNRWVLRYTTYAYFMTDRYPPFSLS